MKTNVVNVKVDHIRPKHKNLKEWINDSNNVYIGRGGIVFVDDERFPKKDSIWANTHKIKKEEDRAQAIIDYEKDIREKIKKEKLQSELLKLEGKNLGCWCKPKACHGDVLIKLIYEFKK
jgi:Domain of unknown function (DUF4326)